MKLFNDRSFVMDTKIIINNNKKGIGNWYFPSFFYNISLSFSDIECIYICVYVCIFVHKDVDNKLCILFLLYAIWHWPNNRTYPPFIDINDHSTSDLNHLFDSEYINKYINTAWIYFKIKFLSTLMSHVHYVCILMIVRLVQ